MPCWPGALTAGLPGVTEGFAGAAAGIPGLIDDPRGSLPAGGRTGAAAGWAGAVGRAGTALEGESGERGCAVAGRTGAAASLAGATAAPLGGAETILLGAGTAV